MNESQNVSNFECWAVYYGFRNVKNERKYEVFFSIYGNIVLISFYRYTWNQNAILDFLWIKSALYILSIFFFGFKQYPRT